MLVFFLTLACKNDSFRLLKKPLTALKMTYQQLDGWREKGMASGYVFVACINARRILRLIVTASKK